MNGVALESCQAVGGQSIGSWRFVPVLEFIFQLASYKSVGSLYTLITGVLPPVSLKVLMVKGKCWQVCCLQSEIRVPILMVKWRFRL